MKDSMKKVLSFLLFSAVLLLVVGLARPAFADPIAEKSPQYAQITQTLTTLLEAQSDPESAGYNVTELNQKISDLRFQKYIMESSEDWGICQNMTAETIGVYGYDPDHKNATPEILYLGAGQSTDDDWACTGVYLPADVQVAGIDLANEGAIATVVDGTRLTISQNPSTNALEFDVPLYQILKASDTAVPLPQFTQQDVASQIPNAPVD